MTKKHFVLLADAIRENIVDRNQRESVAAALIPALRAANPNFNATKFLEACIGE